jgi:hypothetical protein
MEAGKRRKYGVLDADLETKLGKAGLQKLNTIFVASR